MNVKLEVRELWLIDCMVRQVPVAELLRLLAYGIADNNCRRAMAADLAKRQQTILEKAAMYIQDIEDEWLRRQGG